MTSAATASGGALRRIRELEAINAQITRHRDRLDRALGDVEAGRTTVYENSEDFLAALEDE